MTPHIAAVTRPAEAIDYISRTITQLERRRAGDGQWIGREDMLTSTRRGPGFAKTRWRYPLSLSEMTTGESNVSC